MEIQGRPLGSYNNGSMIDVYPVHHHGRRVGQKLRRPDHIVDRQAGAAGHQHRLHDLEQGWVGRGPPGEAGHPPAAESVQPEEPYGRG